MPLAIDKASAYPRGIVPFSGEYGAVGSKLGAAVGTVFDARRDALRVGRAVLYSDGAVLELLHADQQFGSTDGRPMVL